MDAKPWHKRPDETHKAFLAFSTYLELGRERSHVATQKALGHRNKSTITQWSVKYDWVARAQAWDLARLDIAREQEMAREQELKARAHVARLGLQQLALDAVADVFLVMVKMAKGIGTGKDAAVPAFAQMKAAEFVLAFADTLPLAQAMAQVEAATDDPNTQAAGESEGEAFTAAEIEALIEDLTAQLAAIKQAEAAQVDAQAKAPN